MSVLRGPLPTDSYTIVSNGWLRDPRLSWKAKGLLAYIASHAAGHTLTNEQIIAEGKDSRDAIRAGLVELEQAGYLKRTTVRDEQGRAAGTDFELCDSGFPGAGKPVTGPDQAEQDVSAGQNHSGFSGAGESPPKKTTTTKKTKEKTTEASPRGTRLPKDWLPSQDLVDWCAAELVPGGRWSEHSREFVRREQGKFADYWAGVTGQRATKKDWDATWRNWMRRAFERYNPGRPVSAPPFPTAAERNASYAAQQRTRAAAAQELIDQGVDPREAWKRAGEEIAANGMHGGSPSGYIEGSVITNDPPEEVTDSAA